MMLSATINETWVRARNQTLRSPSFQRWAARFPLTRGIARRRANALFDLCAGFVYSQILTACVELGVLEVLSAEQQPPMNASDLASKLGLKCDAATRLLEASASLGILERLRDGRFTLGIHGAAFVGNPSVASLVKHHALLYRDLQDPVALLRGVAPKTNLGRFWSYDQQEKEDDDAHDGRAFTNGSGTCRCSTSTSTSVEAYSVLMASSLSLIAEDVLEAYSPSRRGHRHLLDVAGGEGAFVEAVGRKHPELSLTLFDLPPVARRARRRLIQAGLISRTNIVGGNLFRDPLPTGADLVTLLRVIHDHDDAEAIHILTSVRRALAPIPDSVLLLAEPMAGTKGVEPMGAAYFGFYLLAMGRGRPRTESELRALLNQAGFGRVRSKPTRRPMLSSLLVASVN